MTVTIVGLAGGATAQEVSIDLGGEGALILQIVQLFALLTVLSLAPGIAIMLTCFPFMVTVLSILRQAVGVQQAPPNMMIVSLALFLTWFVMAPVFDDAWDAGVAPLLTGEMSAEEGFKNTMEPPLCQGSCPHLYLSLILKRAG
jgi:flagellar biosynthetic protein FliP